MSDSKVWHAFSAEETLKKLNTDAKAGLTSAEAKKRIDVYGTNELEEKPPPTFWKRLWDQLKSFVVIILIVSAVISFVLGLSEFQETGEITEFVEAGAIMAIVVLNAAIGVIQESKAEEALAALKKMAAPDAQVIRDGHRGTVTSSQLVPGDIVLLEAGSIVPADIRLIESANLKMEEASLTGESVPVNKYANRVLDADAGLGDRCNCGFMSTVVTYGRAVGVVVFTGMETEIGRIAEMLQSVEEEETPLQKKLDELGKMLGIASLAVCALVFVVGLARPLFSGQEVDNWVKLAEEFFMIAVSLAIAAVPEGLPAVVTICLALGMQEMVKRHALIRRLPAVETLGSATVICSDKTGTLTQNQMTVTQIWVEGQEYGVTGKGYNPVGDFQIDGKKIDPTKHPVLLNVLWGSSLCNDSILDPEDNGKDYRMVGDPTEGALVVAAAKNGYWRETLEKDYARVGEIPFDSDRKRMTTIHSVKADGDGLPPKRVGNEPYIAIVKGAPDLVLQECAQIQTEKGPEVLTEEHRQAIMDANIAMASGALRVLAVAYRPIAEVPEEPSSKEIEKNLVLMGLMGMIDPARPEVVPAVKKAQGAGLRTIMVTGDYAATAAAIAKEIGILRPDNKVVSGAELEAMDDAELDRVIDNVDVFARVAPHHKMRIVGALRKRNNIVAMTGDGVNDAPALKRADIGVAMGITGTDVTKQTADMVLTDDNYVSIISAIEQGRIIYSNIRKFVYFLLSCNMAEILILFISTFMGWPPPLTAIQLLWLNLLSDGAPALALGLEKGDPDIMDRPPRPPDEPVINREMIGGVIVQTIAITVAVLWAYLRGLNFYGGSGEQAVATAQTMGFVTLTLSELFRAYTARSERYPLFKLGLFSNKWMQYAIGFSIFLMLLVVYVPFLGNIFNTIPLNLQEWGLILPLTLLPSIVAEVQKWLSRKLSESK